MGDKWSERLFNNGQALEAVLQLGEHSYRLVGRYYKSREWRGRVYKTERVQDPTNRSSLRPQEHV